MTRHGDRRGWDCLIIVLVSTLLALILRPFQDMPFVDDWCWAWPVEHLLKTGRIASLEYGGNHAIFTQVVWGALFCLPGGFSFAALRVSTWVLATVGLCLFYLILREQNVSRRDALIGTALLGFNPMFFVLQFTFMTDVPFVTLTLAVLYAMQRAMRQSSDRWLAIAVIMAILAAGVRSVAVAIPMAMFLALLIHAGRWGRNPLRLIAALLPLAAMAGMLWWREKIAISFADMTGMDTAASTVRDDLAVNAVRRLPVSIMETIALLAITLGPGLLPLSAAYFARGRWWVAAVVAVVITLFWIGIPGQTVVRPHKDSGWACLWNGLPASQFIPLECGNAWGWNELGRLSVPNRPKQVPPAWLHYGLCVLSIASASILAAVATGCRRSSARPFTTWLLLGFLGLVALLWLFYDRYVLPILPLVIVLLLAGRSIPRPRLAMGIIVILAAISVVGLRDSIVFEAAKWQAYNELRAQGIPQNDIDAGYTINCRLQYGQENPRKDREGKVAICEFNTRETARFQFNGTPRPGSVIHKTVTYSQWMGWSRQFYILEYPGLRPPATSP